MNTFENSSPLLKIVYLFLFSLVGLFLAGSLVTLINSIVGGELMQSAWGIRISSGVQMVLMFLMPAITLVVWSGKKPIAVLGCRSSNNSSVLYLIAFAILLAGMPFITLLSQLNKMLTLPEWLGALEQLMKSFEEAAQATTNLLLEGRSIWDFLGNIIFIGAFAAVAEEMFFRGVLQKQLGKLFKNLHTSVWIAAFIFSLMHMQFYGFLPRVVLGAMLGYLFVYSNNLWLPIFVHFLNNALVVALNFFFKENSIYQSLENPTISISFIALGFISFGLLIYLFVLYKAKGDNRIERE